MVIDSVIFFALFVLVLVVVIDTLRLKISPMPSSKKAKRLIFSLVKRSKNHSVVYELGSGFGGLALSLSKSSKVYAFERALIPWIFSKVYRWILRKRRCTILRKDFFLEDFSKADVIVCYLYPKAMERLALKFEKELKNGAIVISNSFQIPTKKPSSAFKVGDWMGSSIYLYQFSKN